VYITAQASLPNIIGGILRRKIDLRHTFDNLEKKPASEDETDTGFRNVGQLQLQIDAGEIPKRTYKKKFAKLQ
jgi:hypothetical protein